MSVYETLEALHIHLPGVRQPAAAYVPYAIVGKLVFVSGHTARKNGEPWVGKLGVSLTTEEGQEAARSVAIDLLGTLQVAVGDLNRVARIAKLTSLVNSSPNFTEHHLVTNGASSLIAQVFGSKGVHARSAFGVEQIPHGACVEIEMIAELV